MSEYIPSAKEAPDSPYVPNGCTPIPLPFLTEEYLGKPTVPTIPKKFTDITEPNILPLFLIIVAVAIFIRQSPKVIRLARRELRKWRKKR